MKPHHPFNEDLKTVLDSEQAYQFLPHQTWMEGGCTLLAMALQRLIPGSHLYSVGRLDQGIPDHTVLSVDVEGEPFYLDYDGLHTTFELTQKVTQEWRIAHPTLAPVDLDLLEQMDMRDLDGSVGSLAKLLASELGAIDSERLDPAWCDDDELDMAPR